MHTVVVKNYSYFFPKVRDKSVQSCMMWMKVPENLGHCNNRKHSHKLKYLPSLEARPPGKIRLTYTPNSSPVCSFTPPITLIPGGRREKKSLYRFFSEFCTQSLSPLQQGKDNSGSIWCVIKSTGCRVVTVETMKCTFMAPLLHLCHQTEFCFFLSWISEVHVNWLNPELLSFPFHMPPNSSVMFRVDVWELITRQALWKTPVLM